MTTQPDKNMEKGQIRRHACICVLSSSVEFLLEGELLRCDGVDSQLADQRCLLRLLLLDDFVLVMVLSLLRRYPKALKFISLFIPLNYALLSWSDSCNQEGL